MRQWQKQTLVIAALATISATATAQTPTAPIATAAAPASQPAVPNQQLLTAPELDGLVAPIALYPDALLSLVMMSSTYPLEVVQAERWMAANKLKGDQLKAAVDKQSWDDSIKSLTATPEVLTMMSTKLDWTQKLGDAVLAQQGDVMDAVQRLRARAQSNDKLKSTKEQNVVVRREKEKQVIVIEQTQPDTVYVPYYDPGVAYGAWPYAEYPPYYFPAPGYIAGGLIATGLVFGAGYALGRWATGGWGGGCNWGGNNLVVNPLVGNNWQHNAAHRHGVRYNNASVQQKFGNNNLRASAGDRSEFRGRDDRQGDRGERQGDRQADRGDRQGDRQVDRGDRQGDRQGDRGERQGDRQANRGDRDGARAGQGAKSDRASPAKGKAAAKGGGNRARAQVPKAAARPAARAGGGALNVQSGSMANLQSARGQASLGSGPRGGGGFSAGAGGGRGGGGFSGGGMRGGGFSGGGGRGGGGRRSDVRLKHDIVLLRHLDNGLGLYRFRYGGDKRAYVGVIAQEAMKIAPGSVTRGQDGYLRVRYDRLGVKFQTYEQWINTGDAAAIH